MNVPPPAQAASADARALAGGSAWVFLGSMIEGGLRLLATWYLSGALGAERFGVYTYAVTIVTLVSLVAPLGMDSGILYFGARWAQTGDRGRRKGYLLTGLLLTLVGGPALSLTLWWMGESGLFWQEKPGVPEAVSLVSSGVAVMAVLIYAVFALRSARDMLWSTLIFQVVVPAALFVGSIAAMAFGFGLRGVIVAFLAANALAMVLGLLAAWRHFGGLLLDSTVRPVLEPVRLLAYSVPQSVPVVIYRLNLWMDIMMLLWLGTAEQVGIYRVAVGLVAMVVFPVGAVNTMFSPQVTQLYHAGEMARLDALLKVATRWLVVLVAPFYLAVVLEHRLILSAFAPEYMASASAVLVLMAGQAVHALCAPANRLLPMSGRSLLDMGISVAAVGLNLALNWVLIPRLGGLGAALSGASTFAAWGVVRVIAAYALTGCQPFTARTVTLAAGAVGIGALGMLVAPRDAPWLHLAVSAAALAAFAGLAATVGRTAEDAALLGSARARLGRLLRR